MQEKYAGEGKFTVVLSYAQAVEPQAIDHLKSNAPSIPAYDQLNPPNAPCGNGIPDAYLFDHTGRLVRHGHPAELYGLVPELVESAPDPIPPGILGAFEPERLAEEAAALRHPNRAVAPTLEALAAIDRGGDDRAAEARALVAQVRGWLPGEVERLEKAAPKRPGATALACERFVARFEGVDRRLEQRVVRLKKELARQPGVKDYVRAIRDLERAAAASDERAGAQFRRRARAALERLDASPKFSAALKKEARSRLVELG